MSTALQRDIDKAKINPKLFSVTLAGNWNFPPPNEAPLILSQPKAASSISDYAVVTSRPHQGRWMQSLSRLVEIMQTAPTYYSEANGRYGRNDRIYSSVPGWALLGVTNSCSTMFDPKDLHEKGVRDRRNCLSVCLSVGLQCGSFTEDLS